MSKNTEHTPGPWRYHQPHINGCLQAHYLVEADGKTLYIARVQSDTMNLTEAEANAQLIAAAPELFEALKVFVARYDAAPDGPLGIGLVNGDFSRAQIAIAKAKGEVWE